MRGVLGAAGGGGGAVLRRVRPGALLRPRLQGQGESESFKRRLNKGSRRFHNHVSMGFYSRQCKNCESASGCFQPGEGSSRGLLRDCEN